MCSCNRHQCDVNYSAHIHPSNCSLTTIDSTSGSTNDHDLQWADNKNVFNALMVEEDEPLQTLFGSILRPNVKTAAFSSPSILF